MKSDSINELTTALSKAQGQMSSAKKDRSNPHLNSKYATLDSIIDAARKPLSDNGLSFTQIIHQGTDGLCISTWLMHSSGQWMRGEVPIIASAGNRGVNEVQALGSALTYYKRYALAAMLGISVAEEDDDGHDAGNTKAKAKPQPQPQPQQAPAKQAQPTQVKEPQNGKPQSQHLTGFPAIVAEVNNELGSDHYTIPHAQNVCKKLIDDFRMPGPNDTEALAGVKSILLDHANAPKAEAPIAEAELPF